MAAGDLNISVNSSGTQQNTGSPQTATQANNNGAINSGSLQPGTAAQSLNSINPADGLQLHQSALPSVNLAPATVSQASTAALAAPRHHTNAALVAIPALLFLVAVVLFVVFSRPVKTTT